MIDHEVTKMHISEKQIEIRYAETDQMGVVYHANYIIWLEIGRAQLIHDLGFAYTKLEDEGYLSPVIDVSIQYKAALRYGQIATVRTWIESHSRLRTTYGYEVLHEDGTVAATAKTVHTLVRKDNFRPISLSKVDPAWDAAYIENMRVQE